MKNFYFFYFFIFHLINIHEIKIFYFFYLLFFIFYRSRDLLVVWSCYKTNQATHARCHMSISFNMQMCDTRAGEPTFYNYLTRTAKDRNQARKLF